MTDATRERLLDVLRNSELNVATAREYLSLGRPMAPLAFETAYYAGAKLLYAAVLLPDGACEFPPDQPLRDAPNIAPGYAVLGLPSRVSDDGLRFSAWVNHGKYHQEPAPCEVAQVLAWTKAVRAAFERKFQRQLRA